LILVENLPVPFDRRVWQEACALIGAGYAVSVICPMGKGHFNAYEVLEGVHIYRHPLREARSTAGYVREYATALYHQLRLSMRVRKRQRIDVIQACNPPDLMFLIALVHKALFRTLFVFDHHDLGPELYFAKFGRKDFAYKAMLLFERLTFRTANGSIATNEVFREIAIKRGGMAPDRVTVVKSFPDPDRFRHTEPDSSLTVRGKHLVGYVGIMGEQDGVETLVRAMAHVRDQHGRDDIACLIIGEGSELSRLRTLAATLKVTASVTFTGYLSGPSLMAHLSALSIGVIPDPPNECNDKLSMNKVFEYMLLGLPFLQFDLPQAASEAGEAATIVKEHSPEALAREIVRLADDPERRQAMSAFGLQTAQRDFQWSVAQANYLAAYQAVLCQEPASHDQRNRAASRSVGSAEPMPGIPALSGKGDGIL
jgi:glycosyltransferase involved in cell wall biosynthesis